MRGLLVLLLLGSGLIFFLQNRDPVLLYFLGNSDKTALLTLSLPLGLWVIAFILLGVFISFALQILNQVNRPTKISQPRPSPRPRPQKTPRPSSPSPSPPQDSLRSPVEDKSDWGWDNPIPEVEDWDIEATPYPGDQLPVESPLPRPETTKEPSPFMDMSSSSSRSEKSNPPPLEQPRRSETVEPRLRSEDLKQFEVSQPPKTSTREGTIYSYTYREPRAPQSESLRDRSPSPESVPPKTTSSASKKVYDANYRVINPPLRSSDTPEGNGDEDEDWV